MHRFDRPTVLIIKTDLTYTVTLQTLCTLPSDNRQDAVVSQPLLRQPSAETERVGRVEIDLESHPPARLTALDCALVLERVLHFKELGARADVERERHRRLAWSRHVPEVISARLGPLLGPSQPRWTALRHALSGPEPRVHGWIRFDARL